MPEGLTTRLFMCYTDSGDDMDIFKYKGFIFDLDGTLIDSGYVWSEVDKRFLSKRGFDVPDDYCKSVSAMNFMQAARYTKARFCLKDSIDDIIKEWHAQAFAEYRDNVAAIPCARDMLSKLKTMGKKIALATASDASLYEPALKRNKMYEYIDFFAQTSQVSRGKGFPDVYELAAQGIGCAPCDCIVFEDIAEGISGAKMGGFAACAVLSGQVNGISELKKLADLAITDFGELLMPKE